MFDLMTMCGLLAFVCVAGPMFLVYFDRCMDKMTNKTTDVVESK
ncbi:MAG: hypothetical protein PHR14_08825 [Oscillospiraceae bacterium]|nr:hypothetical protein [Oscillospiraceae bacterium]